MGSHQRLLDVVGQDDLLGQPSKRVAPDDPKATGTDRRFGQSETRRLVMDAEDTADLVSVAYWTWIFQTPLVVKLNAQPT